MMDRGDTPHGPRWDGTPGSAARLPEGMRGLRVRVTVECAFHGSHSAVMTGPFLWVIDSITLFRDICAEHDRWCVCEYEALDHVPAVSVSEWV